MCQLVKTRGYVHHFNISLQGITSTADFLGNVCAQLIVRYGLPHAELPDSALKDSGFLVSLLSEAAAKSAGKPVVVLVNALDGGAESRARNEPATAASDPARGRVLHRYKAP